MKNSNRADKTEFHPGNSVIQPTQQTKVATLIVPGMGSNHCSGLIRASLDRLSGIVDIQTNIANHQVTVVFDSEKSNRDVIKATVEKAGYDVIGIQESTDNTHKQSDDAEEQYLTQAWSRLWFAAIPTTIIMLLMIPHMFWFPIPGYLFIVAVLAFPVVFLKGGKEDSKAAIKAMHGLNIHVVMVTGDNERTAKYVADQVGLDEVLANVLPEGKVEAVKRLQAKYGNSVAMIGDGINDAPALKQANVGVAIGAGADVTIEAADVTLVKGELTKLVEAILLSRATFRKIVQNLFWAWFYNLAAIPVAALGLLHPMIGVIAMTASSLSVIGNSILLKRTKLQIK